IHCIGASSAEAAAGRNIQWTGSLPLQNDALAAGRLGSQLRTLNLLQSVGGALHLPTVTN
ncbi:MAG: hypothetical protein OEU26_31465, partial [Candidatus Tectomicrobia bacterium]|nr:hypothetical protein [Candidatus Tectomicrobia bacterium]